MGGVHEPGKRLLDTLPQMPHRGLVHAGLLQGPDHSPPRSVGKSLGDPAAAVPGRRGV